MPLGTEYEFHVYRQPREFIAHLLKVIGALSEPPVSMNDTEETMLPVDAEAPNSTPDPETVVPLGGRSICVVRGAVVAVALKDRHTEVWGARSTGSQMELGM